MSIVGQNHFPPELLSRPIAERLAYFESKLISHPSLLTASEKLRRVILHPAGTSIVFLYGPTGVGKTTLRRALEMSLLDGHRDDVERDPDHVALFSAEAIVPGEERFGWKDFFKRAMVALEGPFLRDRSQYGVEDIRRDDYGELVFKPRIVGHDLRRALEKCMRYRAVRAFLIDEAQHIGKGITGRSLIHNMDVVKSLANVTGALHVLIGTYELLHCTRLSAQLSRRSLDIHFPRYRPGNDADARAWRNVVLTFQRHLPLAEEPDLIGEAHYLYERSAGCVGILKDWLNRALEQALNTSKSTVDRAELDETMLSTKRLLDVTAEIDEGEQKLVESDEDMEKVRAMLGLEKSAPTPRESPESPPPARRQSRVRVGKRRPTRDVIG